MGVKSTVILTRERAEAMYAEYRAKAFEKIFRMEAMLLDDMELCDKIESFKDKFDKENGYTNFDNFAIGDPDQKDWY